MDVDLIFLLALLVFYFVSRLGGKKKPQQRPSPPHQKRVPQGEAPAHRDSELDDALREIREALGWPTSSDEPPAEVEPSPGRHQEGVPAPSPVERRPTRLERAPHPDRREPRAVKGRPDVPAREATPSARADAYAAYTGVNAAAPPAQRRLDLPAPESPSAIQSSKPHPLLERLRKPEGAREAVVFAEIFQARWRGGPRS